MRNSGCEWLAKVMLNAEEPGITSNNAEAEAKSTKNPDVARLLSADGEVSSRGMNLDARVNLTDGWSVIG